MADDPEDLESMRLCWQCIGEPYFRAEVRAKGKRLKCTYCGQVGKAYRLSEAADRIETVFSEHFYRTPVHPSDFESSMQAHSMYEWERRGDPIVDAIERTAKIPTQAASDIQAILRDRSDNPLEEEESEFADESRYEELDVDDARWQDEWNRFEQSLKNETRYFNRRALDHLEHVFKGIDRRKSSTGAPLVVAAGPGANIAALYRARVFQSDEKIRLALKDGRRLQARDLFQEHGPRHSFLTVANVAGKRILHHQSSTLILSAHRRLIGRASFTLAPTRRCLVSVAGALRPR